MTRAKSVLEELKKCGVTHVIGLPDNSSAALFSALRRDPEIELISVTREGEAFAVASGLWIGGKRPALLLQNTGFLEAGDSYRGTALRMRVPLVCLITYRGYPKVVNHPTHKPELLEAEAFSRPDWDSVALVTEPTLKAWGLPFDFLREDSDIGKISIAFRDAESQSRPIAVLITGDLT